VFDTPENRLKAYFQPPFEGDYVFYLFSPLKKAAKLALVDNLGVTTKKIVEFLAQNLSKISFP
jgi:hypothetical protein